MREKLLFNSDWDFHEGDIITAEPLKKGPIYMQAKAESAKWGPACKDYNNARDLYAPGGINTELWNVISLPHDYIISKQPSQMGNETLGFFQYDNAWYRKTFVLDQNDADKRLTLYFEGITNYSTVWVNGILLARNFGGYTPFEVDFTDVARFDRPNVVAVYVDTSKHEGWWYEGAGIYRNVWFCKTSKISIDLWGVYVAPKRQNDSDWNTPIETTLRNDTVNPVRTRVITDVLSPDGICVASRESFVDIDAKSKTVLTQEIPVKNPKLWDLDMPDMYSICTTVLMNDTVIDIYETEFGFRTIEFTVDKGFFLNGKHVKINGVCCHEDYGLTGKAIPERVKHHRLALLKEMGANAYRTAHYPHSEYTMKQLDRMGFLVMAETRCFGSSPECIGQLETMIKRDRNHPGIIMWSIGNEEPLSITPMGRNIAQTMTAAAKRLDGTRPVTIAVDGKPLDSTVFDAVDVIGINYNLENIDRIHEKFPDKPIFFSEYGATGTTRGWYFPDSKERGYITAYDHDINHWYLSREKNCRSIDEREWLCGGFQWTGIEHRGETEWPRLCSQSGAIDLFLQKKDAFYQNQSYWTDKPMVHILPHWNFEGHENEMIRVCVYTNCQSVELFLNGKSLGKQEIEKYAYGFWQVPYQSGELKAVGYQSGKEATSQSVCSTKRAVALRLKMEMKDLTSDPNDVALITCYCVDEDGCFVPDADPLVQFFCNEYGTVVGTGSDVSDHARVTSPDRRMRAGLCSLLVRSNGEKGLLRVYAESRDLKTAMLEIPIN